MTYGLKTIIGGAHIICDPGQSLIDSGADYAAAGEGERTITQLASGKDPSQVEGLWYWEKGKPKKLWLKEFAKDIKFLIKKKKQIVIVSSGAIALGCEYLKITKKGLKVDKSQAVASIGQIELM